MNAVQIPVALVGDGPHAQALRGHQGPLGRVSLVADLPDGADWQAAVADPSVRAVLAFGVEAAQVASAALSAGKIAVCGPDLARDAAAVAALPPGILLCGGEIVHGEATRRALAAMADPAFGPLRSLYLAIRQPRGTPGDVIEALGPEALEAVLAAIPDEIVQVRVNAGALFGAERDSAVILLRSASDVVVTIELARCLPPSLPAPGLGEVEIEAMGARQAVRAVPHAGAVRIHRDTGSAAVPWLNAPVLDLLRGLDNPVDGRVRLARVAKVLEKVRTFFF
ncbi:MAG: hypothetical protein NTY94_08375 [Alphaproteobacteria bacterium]|nr:hypothetical protein [Alphaproteobacteria bacterium]